MHMNPKGHEATSKQGSHRVLNTGQMVCNGLYIYIYHCKCIDMYIALCIWNIYIYICTYVYLYTVCIYIYIDTYNMIFKYR